MAKPDERSVADLLVFAATQVMPAPERAPWDYGWSLPEYRRSARAALSGPDGPVTLSPEGLTAWENAATRLLREKSINERWDAEEFWEVLASITVAASNADDHAAFVERSVERLRSSGPSLTILLAANVTWNLPPIVLGDLVVGNADATFLEAVNTTAGQRCRVSKEVATSWMNEQVLPRIRNNDGLRPVAIATWSPGQQALAQKEAERNLRNLVDLCLLLEHDLPAHEVFRRGDVNRPGVRGLTLDRGAVDRGLNDSMRLELASFPLVVSELSPSRAAVQWFGVEPLPLGDLLSQRYLRDAVTSCLKKDPISNRIRVAARWFADAHYTLAEDDAALALGVAMDALLSGQRALPGSAMADRFALLDEDPEKRRHRVSSYLEFYGVRSSIAHGGRSRKLDQEEFLKLYQAAIHWAAWRVIALRDAFTPATDKQIDDLFDDLRWGSRAWP